MWCLIGWVGFQMLPKPKRCFPIQFVGNVERLYSIDYKLSSALLSLYEWGRWAWRACMRGDGRFRWSWRAAALHSANSEKIPVGKKNISYEKEKKSRRLFPPSLIVGSGREEASAGETSSVWGDILLMTKDIRERGRSGVRGQVRQDGGGDLLAISATRRLSLTAWASAPCCLRAGSPLWGTPSPHWPRRLLEGCSGLSDSWENAARGGAEGGRWGRTCARGSCALIWCCGWGRADVEGSKGRTGRGKSTPHWTYWEWNRESVYRKINFKDLFIQSPSTICLPF